MRIGKYQLTFHGTQALEARRKAIGYWYDHRLSINLTLREFLARCQPVAEGSCSLSYCSKTPASPAGEPTEPSIKGVLYA